ncbi:hypothetical protein OQJ18_00065 [Fluoribacter dumoffii]|uniref:hypothetical protein n=1 Tax=Fluoribacter dumoffii TaxID=463 RepID=UPI00026C7F3B|nr:hypothetical protein [Fluoribacter dumoffii]MCW8386438.1 hypothetical protein [Fluoribacter dumoffii]MCW8419491.1 hypothetical protein [Fluoribacter dumoffii]MCW8452634.1 hypothetical protein [Fluoribacter dumoffii]MCW8460115.1 hypothetical protein [Fluoribacter dumoffii]MCW8483594.1 hypothetical protein [Fluoribacter dumoffii]
MAKNTLYNFLNLCVYKNKKLHMGNDIYLIKTQDKKNCPYFRFDLPLEQPISFDLNELELNLSKHHISVYEGENSENPSLSQFHYSAYFVDKKKQEYILHVYFNEHSQLSQLPVLSLISGDDKRTYLEVEEHLSDQFITLAREKVDPVISEVQRRKSEKIRHLQTQYEKDEQQASELSKDLAANKSEHDVVVQRMIKTLKGLNPLFKHDSYIRIAKSLESFIQHQTETNQQTKKHASKVHPTKPKLLEEKLKPVVKLAKNSSQSTSSKFTSTSHIEADLQAAIVKFNLLEKDDAKAINEICNLYAEVNSILLLSEDDDNNALPKDFMAKINTLQLQINLKATTLLHVLIAQRRFDLAKTFTPFHYQLDEKFLFQALEQADGEFLDFLLDHGEYILDNQPVRIKDQTFKSAVHYCFSTCQQKSMASCLSTLLRHGASILVKGANGLPLAHTILSTAQHPLRPALEENKSLTLQSRYFYAQLANLLQNYLMTGISDSKRKEKLIRDMQSYRDEAQSFLLSKDLDKGIGNKLREQIDRLAEVVMPEYQQAIRSSIHQGLPGLRDQKNLRRANLLFKEAIKLVQEDKLKTWNGEKDHLKKLLGAK